MVPRFFMFSKKNYGSKIIHDSKNINRSTKDQSFSNIYGKKIMIPRIFMAQKNHDSRYIYCTKKIQSSKKFMIQRKFIIPSILLVARKLMAPML